MSTKHPVEQIAEDLGAKIEEVGALPDGSGFATMSMALPKDHWLYAEHRNVPPMYWRCGQGRMRDLMAKAVTEAGRYAVRCATMNGREMDFDPDALVQNMVVGLLGYWTKTGLSEDPAANPVRETKSAFVEGKK